MRGRGGRGGRGGSFGGFSQQPTNTISIRVSEIQQPVTEDVMRRVFQSVGVSCNSIQITPTNNPQETSVVAQFPDNFAAERVMSSLNNRNIFNNGNKMAMQYTNWIASGSPAPMAGNGGGVLQTSTYDAANGTFAPQQPQQIPTQQMQPPQQQQQQQMQSLQPQQPPQQQPQQQMQPLQPQHQQMQHMPQLPQQVPQQMSQQLPQQMAQPMQQLPPQQMPQMPHMPMQPIPQMPQMPLFNNPMQGMMQPQQMDGWYGANPAMEMPNVTIGFPGLARGGAAAVAAANMMRGARARGGRGITRGGYGFDPMAMQPGYMQYPQRGGMSRGGGAMMSQMAYAQYQPFGQPPTVFVSVTLVPTTEPLQPIFTLMEAFGGVVAVRRNQNKKEILTIKAASPDDALAIVTYMHRVPYVGGQVSGKLFPNYVERYPCTDEGDPLDPETVQYDFTASRHRSPGQRSKAVPSRVIKITGCNTYEDTELMTYLNGKGFQPERITKSEDGTFEVHMPDVASSVKVLLECQGSVCDEEKSNVIFVEGPRDEPTEQQQQQVPAEQQANEQ
ncbi:hypothetical protein NESM_000014400 [Novymonas esmeraldas]|uniref:PTBP1-like RNA recognition motif 2 domain-containing protein n=1 Tax=Novymonas esmeraldas TaxID=1808958 RepID=A0AAW0EZY2_9TRYP